MVNIDDVLEGHVVLDIECVDRLYLNAYIPNLQVGNQVKRFCEDHLGQPIASPVIVQKIGNTFRRDVSHFAEEHEIPILHLKKLDRTRWDDRKLDHVHPCLEAAERAAPLRGGGHRGGPGVPMGHQLHQEDRWRRGRLVRLEQASSSRAVGEILVRAPIGLLDHARCRLSACLCHRWLA